MPKENNPHKDHRKRVRKEFLENGFSEATPPHKILEMLLFYGIPRKDTNEIAHALLNRFGSVTAILEASHSELMQVEGIGENAAALIKLILPICRLYEGSRSDQGVTVKSLDSLCDFVMRKHLGYTKEVFALTTFNNRGKMIAFDILTQGVSNQVGVSTRLVIEKVIERKAVAAVISHNHPSGNALPSPSDISTTERIASALAHINVELWDHIIVGDDDCVSMAQSQKFQYIFEKE